MVLDGFKIKAVLAFTALVAGTVSQAKAEVNYDDPNLLISTEAMSEAFNCQSAAEKTHCLKAEGQIEHVEAVHNMYAVLADSRVMNIAEMELLVPNRKPSNFDAGFAR